MITPIIDLGLEHDFTDCFGALPAAIIDNHLTY